MSLVNKAHYIKLKLHKIGGLFALIIKRKCLTFWTGLNCFMGVVNQTAFTQM